MKLGKFFCLTLLSIFFCCQLNANMTTNIMTTIKKFVKTQGIGSVEKTFIDSGTAVYYGKKLVVKRSATFYPHTKYDLGDGYGKISNIDRMKMGQAPIGIDGKKVELHHLKQKDDGIIVELTNTEHNINHKELHRYKGKGESEIDRKSFNQWRKDYWTARAKDFE